MNDKINELNYAQETVLYWHDKRILLSGMAMQGFVMADPRASYEDIAQWSVKMADTLIEALESQS